MQVEIARHALDRVPLSIIFDDSTMLVNLNYFFMRDRNLVDGENRRWEDVPVVHPESFVREFGEWCLENGVKGKYSVVPCPAALGRIDHGLPLFSQAQQDSWLHMCREVIMPSFDITPEMMTHTYVVDLETCRPLESGIWEQYDWDELPTDQEELVTDYITLACRILDNVGLTPAGVTSPGGFGRPLPFYAKCAQTALQRVTGNATPYFFKRIAGDGPIETPVWYPDADTGTAMGEIIACTGDWTGSWTGYGEVDADRYITADLEGGRLPAVIDAGGPAVLISHWQGFYGLHNDDRRGFRAFKKVVGRLRERDTRGERTQWRTCSEITRYACAREMATATVTDNTIALDLPVRTPEFTLALSDVDLVGVAVDGVPLDRAGSRAAFRTNTFYRENDTTFVAFDPQSREVNLTIDSL
ncbi:MAG: hypothetical protein HN742_34460 [Lentisphaerae bacterium]|jgi:hypothetical protein|nr:hypothetical protein [Lentisphaerota bacterium]MBT4822232.1 hypothetical protein [Lentisphaerota bacterium]MBT5605062.1 hypothetical protein [Lentisphaerota bacterium]MBT7058684.1 hypothetical protein [Lentisphaerota bacterium]MBT7847025.1 hypothetical protein [Lentisphaerota bacterium]